MPQKLLDSIIWDKWSKGKKPELKSSELGWEQDVMPWKAEFKRDASSDQPFVYRAEGRYISFKPDGLAWVTSQGQVSIKQGVNSSVGKFANGKVAYANALGTGMGLEVSVDQTTWRKNIVINSLASLGSIPSDAEYLEISFEIETDFDIESWDKKTELKFTEAIQLSELSKLESIKAWDNHVLPEPNEGEEPEDPLERCSGFLRVVGGKLCLVKQIPIGYLKNAVYPVITDIAITYGSEYTFKNNSIGYVSATKLDSTHFVVAWREAGSPWEGIAKVGVVSSGDVITYGAEYPFNSTAIVTTGIGALDSTHFVVAYSEGNNGNLTVGTVSNGDEIAYGAEYTFHASDNVNFVSIAVLDSTHFVAAYKGFNGWGSARVGIISNVDEVAFGSEYMFRGGAHTYPDAVALDSTHFVVVYTDTVDDRSRARVGTVSSGDVIAYGAEYEFAAVDTNSFNSVTALDSTHFVVAYRANNTDTYGKAVVGIVSSGDNIAFGTTYTFSATGTTNISTTTLDSTHFVVAWDNNLTTGESIIGTVSNGDDVAYSSVYQFNAVYIRDTVVPALDSTHFVVVYRDVGGNDYGESKIGIVSGLEPPSTAAPGGSPLAQMIQAGLV